MPTKKPVSSKPRAQKFSDLVPFMLVLGIFCAISIYLLTSFFVTLRGQTYEASVLIAAKPITGEPHAVADGYIFKDVPSSHQNAAAILYFRDTNIISGYEDGTFQPVKEVNRAEFLKMLVSALSVKASGAGCFNDVASEWFAPYVCYAKNQGWVSGYSDGTYKPAQTVNKAEAVKITLMAFGYDVPDFVVASDVPFVDTPATHWYTPYVYVGLTNNLLEEKDDLEYHPGDSMKRAGTVELIYRAMTDKGMTKPTI